MRKNIIFYFILFTVSFLYLQLFGKGIFFYHENKSLFIFTLDYLEKNLSKPGGFLKYAADFIIQFYYINFFGSFINSLAVTSLALLSNSIVKRVYHFQTLTLPLILLLPIGIIICQADYRYNILHSLGLLMSFSLFLFSIKPITRSLRIVFLLSLPLFYYISGTYAILNIGIYLIYAITSTDRKKTLLFAGLQMIVLAVTIVLSSKVVFLKPIRTLTGYPLVFNEYGRITIPMLSLYIMSIIFPAIVKISQMSLFGKLKKIIEPGLVVILFSALVFFLFRQYNPVFEKVMKTEKFFLNNQFDKVISEHEQRGSSNIVEQFYYNLALSEKGRLCDRMFFGRQDAGPMSLSLGGNREQASRIMHYYFALGLVNEARHLAFELMVNYGYTPENLKMLIKTELINGNYRVAERYINVLKRTFRYRSEAHRFEKFLTNTEMVKKDPELGEKSTLMPREDFFIHTEDAMNIDLLIRSNPLNRKAFEYKMARLMLEKDIIGIAEEAKNLKKKGYSSIPRHICEALAAYRNYTDSIPDIKGLVLPPDTYERFRSYVQNVNSKRGDKVKIEESLSKKERNTFWYYLQFGKIRGEFLKSKPVDRNIY